MNRRYQPLRQSTEKGLSEQVELREKMLQGATASHLAEFAQEVVLPDQEQSIRKRIFAQIDSDDPLDPLKAAQAWIELRSAYRIVERLKRIQLGGKAAFDKLSEITPKSE